MKNTNKTSRLLDVKDVVISQMKASFVGYMDFKYFDWKNNALNFPIELQKTFPFGSNEESINLEVIDFTRLLAGDNKLLNDWLCEIRDDFQRIFQKYNYDFSNQDLMFELRELVVINFDGNAFKEHKNPVYDEEVIGICAKDFGRTVILYSAKSGFVFYNEGNISDYNKKTDYEYAFKVKEIKSSEGIKKIAYDVKSFIPSFNLPTLIIPVDFCKICVDNLDEIPKFINWETAFQTGFCSVPDYRVESVNKHIRDLECKLLKHSDDLYELELVDKNIMV